MKPVAWRYENKNVKGNWYITWTEPPDGFNKRPLYEHPPEVTELRKDAERYRWLMKDDGHNALMSVLASLCASDDPIKPQMDDAIDRAIAATEQ